MIIQRRLTYKYTEPLCQFQIMNIDQALVKLMSSLGYKYIRLVKFTSNTLNGGQISISQV